MIRSFGISLLCMWALLCAALAHAQTATVPVELVVNWPPLQLVEQKYGPLPKWAAFGEVTGCDRGTTNITYGEADVIAAIRTNAGYQAFSRQDAINLVANSQIKAANKNPVAWLKGAANAAVDSKAAGLIAGGNRTGVAIVVGAELIKVILPDLSGVLTAKQIIQYQQDGLQTTMAIAAGRCAGPFSVLFAVPAVPPAQKPAQPVVMRIDVPTDR